MAKSKKSQSRRSKRSAKAGPKRSRKHPQRRPSRKGRRSKNGFQSTSIPAAQAMVSSWRAPKWIKQGRRNCRFEHLEYVSAIAGYQSYDNAAAVNSWRINPGVAATFPFLSTIAAAYEQYRFHGMEFIYVPSVGTNIAGNVVLAPDYDPRDYPIRTLGIQTITEQELLDFEDREIGVPFSPFTCTLSVADMFPMGPRKYITTYGYASDARTSDCGSLIVAAYGAAADGPSFGKLFVRYDVELWVPARDAGLVGLSAGNNFRIRNTAAQTLTTNVAANLFGGGTATLVVGNTNGITVFTDGGIGLPAGWWWVRSNVTVSDTTATLNSVAVSTYAGGLFTGGGRASVQYFSGVFTTPLSTSELVYIPSDGTTVFIVVTASFTGGVTTINAGDGDICFERAW